MPTYRSRSHQCVVDVVQRSPSDRSLESGLPFRVVQGPCVPQTAHRWEVPQGEPGRVKEPNIVDSGIWQRTRNTWRLLLKGHWHMCTHPYSSHAVTNIVIYSHRLARPLPEYTTYQGWGGKTAWMLRVDLEKKGDAGKNWKLGWEEKLKTSCNI